MIRRSEMWYIAGVVFTLAFAAGYALGAWTLMIRGLI